MRVHPKQQKKPLHRKNNHPVLFQRAQIQEQAILINIGREWRPDLSPEDLYERTRRWWVLNPDAHSPSYGMAVANGIIRQVYRIANWSKHDLRKTKERAPSRKLDETKTLPKQHIRWQFSGQVAPEMQHYIGKSVAHYRRKGAQNPILYINC